MAERQEQVATIKPHREVAASLRVPSLTILFHPGGPARAGEVARLVGLLDGKACALSRLAPEFAAHGAGAGEPLLDGHVSRTPVRIERDGDGLLLHAPRGALRIDGRPVEKATVPRDALERGVVLELADRVVLLLHLLGPPAPRAPALGLVGGSEAMERLRGEIVRIADLDVPVLLHGETGTGKGLAASALAAAGSRRGPFVTVNLATALAASELFGQPGSDPAGAAAASALARARGGTLFLDQIGFASLELQGKILGVLEARELAPPSAAPREASVRVLAATDEDLEEAIGAGRFRRALHQRLCGYRLHLPPLRARRDDLGPLLVHFLGVELEAQGAGARLESLADSDPWLPPSLVARLARHSWPGNVRELASVVRRLVLASRDGRRLDEHALPPELALGGAPASLPNLPQAPSDGAAPRPRPEPSPSQSEVASPPSSIGDERLSAALQENGWRIGATARALGISRTSLYALIESSRLVRKAKDVPADEVRASYAATEGDVEAMAEQLHVSSRGIRLRLKELGLA